MYKPFSNTIVKIADSWESGTLVDRATGQEVDPNNPPLDPNIKPWDGKGPAPAPSENPYEVNLESAGNNFVKIVGDPQGLKMLDNALDDLNKNSQSSESIGDSQYKLNDSGDTDLPYGTSTNVCLNYSQRAAALLVSKGIDAYTVIYNGVDSSGEVSLVGVAIKVGVVKYPNSKSGDDYVPTFAVIEPQQDKNGQADYVMGQLGADGTQVTNAYNNADWGFMRIDNAIVIDKYNIPVGAGNWPIATDKSEIYTYTLNPVGIGSNKYITDLSAKQDLSVEVDKNN